MDERVWVGLDYGVSGEKWMWEVEWMEEELAGLVERVDQERWEESVGLRMLEWAWEVEVWMLMVLVGKVWQVEGGGWYVEVWRVYRCSSFS